MKKPSRIYSAVHFTVRLVIIGTLASLMLGCEKMNDLVNKNGNSNVSRETAESSNANIGNSAKITETNQNVANLKTDSIEKTSSPSPQPENRETVSNELKTTEIGFVETDFQFGIVRDGDIVTHEFEFRNTGTSPLVIKDAGASCLCTTVGFPKEPIPPGGMGKIAVRFDSRNRAGRRTQKAWITANTNPPQSFVYLAGEVSGIK